MKIPSRVLQSPAVVTLNTEAYPSIRSAVYEMDVDLLLDTEKFLLGWVGVCEEGEVSEIIASPFFDTLEKLEKFCSENIGHYQNASLLQFEQGACLQLQQYGWF